MTQSFYNRYNDLRDEVKNEIIDYINKHECGDIHNSEEEFYDLPRTFYVDKYGHYNEYAILGARIECDRLIFDGFGLGNNYGHDMAFYEYELNLPTMIEILDELYKIPINPKLINTQVQN